MASPIDFALSRSRTFISLFALLLMLGAVCYAKIAKEKEPDINIPIIYVMMTYQGISPEDAERLLIKPMEKELRGIEGVKEMTSYAAQGSGSVTLEFNAGFDSDQALIDVREKVDTAKSELPQETDEPRVKEVNLSLFPVVSVILSGDIPERAMLTAARLLEDAIESSPNVLSVDIGGDREETVEIIIKPEVLKSYNINQDVLALAASGYNSLIASGSLNSENGGFSIKVPGLIEDLQDILSIPIKVSGNAVVTVGDIADIRKTYRDPVGFARVNGNSALALEVSKRTGANIIATVAEVKEQVEAAASMLPPGLNITYSGDASASIIEMLRDLENNIILAVLLVSMVIIMFVGIRAAILIGLAIPGAFLLAVAALYLSGMTMNLVVLFSLILSVGMLVDSAIVVCELADKNLANGMGKTEAYAAAAHEVKWPLISSTITTLIVFLPLLFWPGIVGEFMQYMPRTLILTLSGSLLMALIFIPAIGAAITRKRSIDHDINKDNQPTDIGRFTGYYQGLLSGVLRLPAIFVLLTISGLFISITAFVMFGKGVEFFPDIEPENINVNVMAQGNFSAYEQDKYTDLVENTLLPLVDSGDLKIVYTRSGAGPEGAQRDRTDDTIGVIRLELAYWEDRRKAKDIIEDIRKRAGDIAGVRVEVQAEQGGPKSAKPIELVVRSYDKKALEQAITHVRGGLETLGGLIDIEDNRPVDGIEWVYKPDREAMARFGNTMQSVGNFIRMVTNGLLLTTYRPNGSDEEIDILARFPSEYRQMNTLDYLEVITSQGAVPASLFVTKQAQQKVSIINRTDGMRSFKIGAGVDENVTPDNKIKEFTEWLQENPLPEGVFLEFKGDKEQQEETASFLQNAFLLALTLMGIVLLTQFNSFYQTMIIMSAVFLSTAGVFIGLLVSGQPFGIVMCGVGVISLAGIVVNNNIILIDNYNRIRDEEGADPKEAVIHACRLRLRPILLTAGTTILGLIPMAIGMNINFMDPGITFGAPSGQWWQQLATAIAGGLAFATMLTLFFTPALLLIGARLSRRFAR